MKYLCFLITYLSISSAAPSLEANTRDHRRIIGGDEAAIEDFPYMGALLFKEQNFCGAALISNDTVVTAAHCVELFHITDLSVRLGSSQWRSGGQKIVVKQVTIHPEYLYPYNDIAVVKLNGSVNVANAVPILPAAQGSLYLTGTPGVVSGWGMTSTDKGSESETLRKVEVPVYDQTQCRDAYPKGTVTDRMICAGYKEGGKTAYFSDSGGPYVINDELVGIVSFGPEFPSDDDTRPAVYTFVPAYNDWIYLHA